MRSTVPASATAAVATAAACAFSLIATQVAGKATRDALFLTNFNVASLPLVLIASAALSIVGVLVSTRAMAKRGPLRVIPPLFFASGILLVLEWLLATRSPRPAACLVYLHIAGLTSILISGFWSIINEHFDPRSARKSIGRIVGGATLGGLFGGLLAERVAAYASVLWVLPLIAMLQIASGILLLRFRSGGSGLTTTEEHAHQNETSHESGFRVLMRVGYLRNLALIVLLGNVVATMVDFVFKVQATQTFTSGAELTRFFAVFYTVVSVMTLLVQTGMTRLLLESIGIANTLAVRPAVMAIGGLVTLPTMGLIGPGILRAVDAVVQSSLFRSGYELLFTPVAPADKRRTKAIIDVGADRMGDIVGGAIIRLVIFLPIALADNILVILAVVLSAIGFWIARALRRGYIRALETNLVNRGDALGTPENRPVGMRTMMMESFTGIDLPVALGDLGTGDAAPVTTDEARATSTTQTHPLSTLDPEVSSLIALRSGDANRVRSELRRTRTVGPVLAAQVITLLAWDDVSSWASRTLAKSAPAITGQLIDRMLDGHEDFAVRRRIPRILATCNTSRAQEGLLTALADPRFEVRFQAARALARIHQQAPSLALSSDVVYAAVQRETRVDPTLWHEQRIIDAPEEGEPQLIDGSLQTRTSRSLEHVFTILSLVLPRAPLQVAFKGLLTSDPGLRGTGLEYLESVLPKDIWKALQPFLDDTRPRTDATRPGTEVLDELMRSSQSIELNLEEIRKQLRDE